MKKLVIFLAFLIGIGLQSCEDPKAPVCKLVVDYDPITDSVKCNVTITEDNGCKFFPNEGVLWSLRPTPMRADKYTEDQSVNLNSAIRSFQYSFCAEQIDTTYYIRAYVKSNYGTGYSEILTVKTDHYKPIVLVE